MTKIQNNIKITESAKKHFLDLLATEKNQNGIVFGINNSGCSGLTYKIDLTYKDIDSNEYTVINGLNFLIKEEDLYAISDTTIDFIQDGLNSQIKFTNPKSTNECGCGISFQTK